MKLVNTDPEKERTGMWDAFIREFGYSKDLIKPSEHILEACRGVGFPDELLDFMGSYGFGNYGRGMIKLIDPEDYLNSLYTWLGGQDFSKIPFMMTGFGDIFYFRALGDGEYDISLLDIHYRRITVPAWTVKEFTEYLTSPETEESVLRKKLFILAEEKCGPLEQDEIFFFVPALVAGGAEDIKYISKGNARVHHQVLFRLGQG